MKHETIYLNIVKCVFGNMPTPKATSFVTVHTCNPEGQLHLGLIKRSDQQAGQGG